MIDAENRELVKKWQLNKDEIAATQLYKNIQQFIKYVIYKKLYNMSNRVDCESIANEAFTYCINHYKVDSKSKFTCFLAKNITSRTINEYNRYVLKFRPTEKIEKVTSSTIDDILNQEEQDALLEKLNKYSKENSKKAEILKLRFVDNLAQTEICDRLNLTKANVSISLKRSMKDFVSFLHLNGCNS